MFILWDVYKYGLEAVTHRKLINFAFEKNLAKSESVRVLIKNDPLEINARNRRDTFVDSLKGKRNKNSIREGIYLSDEVLDKLKKLRINNDASAGEIIRQLISATDLNTLKFKTKGENILAGKWKKGKGV